MYFPQFAINCFALTYVCAYSQLADKMYGGYGGYIALCAEEYYQSRDRHLRFKFILTLVRYQSFYITLHYVIIHWRSWRLLRTWLMNKCFWCNCCNENYPYCLSFIYHCVCQQHQIQIAMTGRRLRMTAAMHILRVNRSTVCPLRQSV